MSTPPYMRLYWGDYHRGTRHLRKPAEHGAYLLLIGALWDAGGKLPADEATLARHALCTPKEWAGLRESLMPFFKVSRGHLTHKRVTEELAKYDDTVRKRKMAGKTGGETRARNSRGNREALAKQKPTKPEPELESEENPPKPPEGEPKTLFELQPKEPIDPVETAFAEWNDVARRCGLPVAKDLDAARRRAISKRLDDAGLDGWREALRGVERSAFLRGIRPGSDGRTMRADLGFVCQAKSFPRLREGFYGADAPEAREAKGWSGPSDVRGAVAKALPQPEYADAYLGACTWRDVPSRALVTANRLVFDRLSDCGAALSSIGVQMVFEGERAA